MAWPPPASRHYIAPPLITRIAFFFWSRSRSRLVSHTTPTISTQVRGVIPLMMVIPLYVLYALSTLVCRFSANDNILFPLPGMIDRSGVGAGLTRISSTTPSCANESSIRGTPVPNNFNVWMWISLKMLRRKICCHQ
ncbi:hypothetical protein SCLCIDRAFT_1102726 [Scleroderma citrinum Foug A]|uniref:Uncharacterized protein n=1 Tax=Scleroderma citrinum Foug A TaxID=1036808 RepID=A0A0C3DPP6_9AGAM|nr:hypothetical protein SCLCIDRAFT_1102726 [Scleroderma citrinum Foug A]